jgi:hypothetical protein
MRSTWRGALAGSLASLSVAFVAACGGDDSTTVQFEVVDEVAFASQFVTASGDTIDFDLGEMTELETGVWIQDLEVAVGDTAVQGDTVFVTYTGWLRDGVEFDSGEFSFIFFDGRTAIGGLHWGTQGQQVGGERLIVIPPEWAYGSASVGPIYPGATLVFDVVLDSIKVGVAP